jgi:ferrochelatase
MKKAVIFLNMGAPRNLDEVELFLKNMFNDKNIITVKSNILRKFIAFMIVTLRKNEAKLNYKKLGGVSPLVKHTKEFEEKAREIFKEYEVTTIMRYTPPFAKKVLKELKKKAIEDITLIPLYPQYSTTTTKSSFEDFDEALKEMDFSPKVTKIERFYKEDFYLNLIKKQILKSLDGKDAKEFELVFSAHSLPEKIVNSGDLYQKEVEGQVSILKEMLKVIGFKDIHLAYQSKLGPIKWLEPSLKDKLYSLNSKSVLIYPISFILDNSETEFELSIEYKEVAKELGFKNYIVSPCINDNREFLEGLREMISNFS